MKKLTRFFIILTSTFLLIGCNQKVNNQPQNSASPKEINKGEKTMPSTKLTKPKMIIDKNKKYQAVLKTTAGEITIDLKAKQTPITVNNFVYLARKGFYKQTIFHRVIKNFMIQGGDPTGTGSGGPGYSFNDEPFHGDYLRGTVAMANSGPNTNGSQFFIMQKNNPLPKNYVIFGQVSKGMEVVDKIANAKTKPNMIGESSQLIDPVKIKLIKIIEK